MRGGLCAVLGANETAAKLLTSVTGDPLGVANLAGGLRRKLCSDDPDNDPKYDPEFTGGQCPIRYNVTGTYTSNQTDGGGCGETRNWVSSGVFGPITGVSKDPGVQQGWKVYGGQSPQNCVDQQNGKQLVDVADCGPSVSNFTYRASKPTISSVTPLFGEPDNCGDPPPPPLPPPTNVDYGDDITYNIDDSTEITVPVSFTFAPVYVDIDGSVKIPVKLDVGGIEFKGTVSLAPEFEFNYSPTFPPAGPGSPDDPDGIGEPGGGSEPIDDVEDLESTIVGVLVYSDIDPDAGPSGIEFETGPDIYVPRLASVTFAIKTKNSIGWTPDQDVKNLECYVPCLAPQGAIAVRVNPVPGVQSRFTAVRGIPLTTF